MGNCRLLPVVLSILLIVNLPSFETGASDGVVGDRIVDVGRGNELVVNAITVILDEEDQVNGVYVNGHQLIDVNFTLNQDMMNVNVTLNTSHDGAFVSNTTEFGNMTAQTNYSGYIVDFTDPGLYVLNATVEGWLNGTGMVYGYKQLAPINFTTVIEYRIDVTITGSEAAGAYAARPPIQIGCTVNFTGNVLTAWTDITVDIVNTTSQAAETGIVPDRITIEGLMAGMNSIPQTFVWIPSAEGATSHYEITVTATNVSTGVNHSITETVLVDNITIFGLVDVILPQRILITLPFDVTVYLNNTGNIEGATEVCLSIFEKENTSYEIFNWTKSSGNIDHMQKMPTELVFTNVTIDEFGEFKVKVRVVNTGENIIRNLSLPSGCGPPQLVNRTISPEHLLREGTEITFSVTYKNYYQGNVTLFMDDWPLEMVNSSDDWSGGVEFTYTLLALKGTHYYYFFAENILGGNTTLKNATGEPFTFNVTETEPGWVLGKITDSDGNNVSGVKLVIYSTKLNENGVTVLDEYFNTTTDAYGCYMKWLPISKYNYVIRVNERWLKDNGYTYATPGSGTFLIDYDHEMQWMNFTLEKPEWIHACLMGNVGDLAAQNSLSGVKISIGVFVDVKSQENMAIEGVNIIVNVTTRSWMNLTAVTDENGSFTITRVPFSTPAPGDLTIAAIRKYIHGIDTVPMPATPGRWRVTASKTGYEDHIETLRFSRAKTTWWNISMGYTPEPEKFNITGRVSPSRVVVTIDGAEVEVDPLTGIFIIENLSAGSYTLGFAADGYVTQYRNVTIIDSDMDIGEIRWPPPPPPPKTYFVTIGPFMDGEDAVSGIIISFELDGELYEKVTGSDGTVTFELPVDGIPRGTLITAKKGDREFTWSWGGNPNPPPPPPPPTPQDEEESNLLLIVSVIVLVFIITIIVVVGIKSRCRETEAPARKELRCHHCDAPNPPGNTRCVDCGRNFRCYHCRELITLDSTICKSCGADFENDEMLFSVNENDGTEIHEKTSPPGKDNGSISNHSRTIRK